MRRMLLVSHRVRRWGHWWSPIRELVEQDEKPRLATTCIVCCDAETSASTQYDFRLVREGDMRGNILASEVSNGENGVRPCVFLQVQLRHACCTAADTTPLED